MKNSLCFLLLPILLFSCNTKQKDQEATTKDSITIAKDSTPQLIDAHYFWAADEGDSKGLSMKKTRPVSADSLTASSMLGMLNSTYPEIQLAMVKTSGDTIFLKIDKSNYLTKQIGSTGAEAYLAEVTYNLTELSGINCVDIRFKQGDHAEPGTYARTDFVREGN
ncbi:MAG: hypothetical protein IPP72_14790 [Chitinophagaceae bacterium]|nr:hypothetical protein [Chitinophagaceae bacterium]